MIQQNLFTLLILLAFCPIAAAKSSKTAQKSGHPAYQRTLIFDAESSKARAQVVLAPDALADVSIKVPLLTLQKKADAKIDDENTEAEMAAVKESTTKIAPAKAAATK